MPNSLITMNRFWLSQQDTANVPDQAAIANAFPPCVSHAPCQNLL